MRESRSHIDGAFLWHQFTAGSKWRFVSFILVGLFFGGMLFVDPGSVLMAVGSGALVSFYMCFMVLPEPGVFRSYGMDAARTRRNVLALCLPVGMLVAAACLMMCPLRTGAPAALAAMVSALVYSSLADPVGDGSDAGATDRSRRSLIEMFPGRGGFFAQFVWRPLLVWALIAGVTFGLLAVFAELLTSSRGELGLLRVLVPFPVLVYLLWAARPAEWGGVTPLMARALGIPMKRWFAQVIPAAVIAGLCVGTSAYAVHALVHAVVRIGGPGYGYLPFVAVTAVSVVVTFTAVCSGRQFDAFAFPAAFFSYFWMTDLFELPLETSRDNLVTAGAPVLLILAVTVLVGVTAITLTMTGHVNVAPRTTENGA
ncbi:hypothetical protein CAQUA_10920 [Corynebacterium aquatimens]|nr:hypothetical protein CAQUA_10920 [Corynebacterium aquatimens]